MKKIRKSLLLLLPLTLLASCKDKGEDKGGEMLGHFDHKVTIKFVQAYAQGYQSTLQQMVDEFKVLEPNVEINLEDGWLSGNYDTIHTQTINDIKTGEYGDLVIAYADHVADYLDYGKAVKLDPYMDNPEYGFTEDEKDDLVQGFLSEGRSLPIPGTWALPFSKSTEAMYYNKDRLIGLDLSAYDATINDGNPLTETYINSLTWEELFGKLCPAFAKYDKANPTKPLIIQNEKMINSYVGYDSDSNLFITLAEQYGYGYTSMNEYGEASLDFNNDNMKKEVKVFAEAAKNHYFASAGCVGGSYCSSNFTAQNCLFCIGSTAGVKNQNSSEFQVGVARIPQAAGKQAKVISQGPSLCILSHGDKDRELASWLFYKHLTNTANSALWGTTVGYLPVRTSSYTDEVYIDYCDETGKPARSLELLSSLNAQYSSKVSEYVFSTPAFKGSSTARTQVGAVMLNAMKDARDGTTVDDAYLNSKFNAAVQNILKDMAA